MASRANFSKDLCAEHPPPITQLLEPENEDIPETLLTMNLIAALPSAPTIDSFELEADNTAPPSVNTDEASGIPNNGEALRTEADGIGFTLMTGDENVVVNLTTALPSAPTIDSSELETDNKRPPSFNTEEASGTLNKGDTLRTEADGIGFSLMSDDNKGPQIIIEAVDPVLNMRLMVIVSMLSPFADSVESLIHAGDFIVEVTPATTIRDIKYGITGTLEICYEDMALLFIGKFLSDSRTLEYYMIGDGQTLHLLVETPNKLFKDVFEAFKRLSLSEEKAWFATRGFINVMHEKYDGDGGFGNDESPALTEALLLHELEQLYVPDSDDSDDSDTSSADENENEPVIPDVQVEHLGGIELELVKLKESDNSDQNEEQDNSENGEQNSDDEEQNSEGEDSDDEDETDDEDEDNNFDFLAQVLAHFSNMEMLN